MSDERNQKNTRDEELDRFWDIDALLPRKRSFPRSTETEPVVLEIPPKEDAPDRQTQTQERIPPREDGKTVVHSVAPVGNISARHSVNPYADAERAKKFEADDEYEPSCALIHRVRIFEWRNDYRYYEEFASTAEKLQTVRGVPCRHVKFFSYVPQYSQMTRDQFGWYLWFRECVRQGEYPETDDSYILLYAYEIINLSHRLDPSIGQANLLGMWLHYREKYPRLDSYFPEWICDYSLIHHLPPPTDLDMRSRVVLMQRCALKEFYVPGDSEEGYLQALLVFCSNYDYKRSKFCTEENRPLFDRVMKTVLRRVTDRLSREGKLFSSADMEDSRLTRDAYSGALCSYRIKRKLEIYYCSFSRSHELRFLITDILKYTENKLRAYLGVLSKLTIYALPIPIRGMIDECVSELLPARRPMERPHEEQQEYDKLYDAPSAPLSLSHAAEIEQASWDTTQRLVEAFEELPEETENPVPVPVMESQERVTDENDLSCVFSPYRTFLVAVLEENFGEQARLAKQMGKLIDAVAEEINELAADAWGDVLLEDTGDGYRVIDDYRNDLKGVI